ncbi:HAMP domain-containing protein [Fontimonas thermophila]|uniref:HAMP domain-containing protein n=1 Tax=Fontimonas thermophila TaxID=1076937 RepID=A0A1I2HCX0_9GAMM|nr:GGDEF domain-containing phosphodiesterase [Fontimonas thermophila]SFF26411.1 HAMP domain-containing protein [Fontimonas thermophila]
MTVRTKFIAVIVLVNLAIALAGVLMLSLLGSDQDIEPELRGRANRISMSIAISRALSEAHYQAEQAQQAFAAGADPAPALQRLEQALDAAVGQLRFLPSAEAERVARVQALLGEHIDPIKALLLQPPTPDTLAQLSAWTLDLQYRTGRAFADLLETDNSSGLAGALRGLATLRGRLGIALGIVGGAWLLSLALSVWAYRRLIQPLGAVTGSLNAVLTGHQPNQRLQETPDEFGDIVRAIRKLRAQAEHIRRIAYEDPGTGLPNRNSLDLELREVRRLRPIDGTHGLILIGIDTYDSLRSGFGLRTAEAIMRAAAERLHALDHMPVSVFRVEPQILGVLVDRGIAEAVTRADLKRITAEAFSRLGEPVEVENQRYLLGFSAGAAIYPDDARDPEEYVNVCLEALRQARTDGTGQLRFGERGHTHRQRKHLVLAEQIRAGLREGQFIPFFQPVVDAARGKVIGAEVLVRWRQPDGRVVLPGEFILIAEGSETIRDMTRAVLIQACRSVKAWAERGFVLTVSFNLSPKLLSPYILQICREALTESGLPPSQLIAEVTETALVGHLDAAAEILRLLRASGIQLCLDDFGTGYSSITHLYRFQIDRIKIDPIVARAAAHNARAAEIIRSLAELASRLSMSLVVEGVETEEDARRLRELGCALQQGFLYSRALPEEQFIEWSRQFESRAVAA